MNKELWILSFDEQRYSEMDRHDFSWGEARKATDVEVLAAAATLVTKESRGWTIKPGRYLVIPLPDKETT